MLTKSFERLNASVFEILPLILGLSIFLYSLSPIRVWRKFVLLNHIEIIVIVAYIAIIILGLLLLRILIHFLTINWRVSKIDIILLLSAIYSGCYFISQYQIISNEFVFESFALIVLYVLFRGVKLKLSWYFLLVFPITSIAQILYGIKNQTGYFAPGYGFQNISGVFHNTGLLGGYMAITSIVTLGLVIYSKNLRLSAFKRKLLRYGKALLILCFIILFVQLIASNSRAAWLGFLAGILYLFCSHFSLYSKFLNFSSFKKVLLMLAILCLVSIMFYDLYGFKKGSADGRALIWQVSFNMIKEKPLFGQGLNGFQAHYMEYQAAYFKNHPGSPFSHLADDNHLAFNEFLRIWIEQGVIGLVLPMTMLYLLFFNNKGERKKINKESEIIIAKAALLALFTFSLFSYPMEGFQFKVSTLYFVALVSKYSPTIKSIRIGNFRYQNKLGITYQNTIKIGIVTLWLAVALILFPSIHDYAYACKKWDSALKGFNEINYAKSIESLETVYPKLKNNGIFLTTFGKALNISGHYYKAIPVLQRANCLLSSATNYIELGKSYKETGDFENAENAWIKASYMIPSKFSSKYLLAKMLFEIGKTSDSQKIAKELLCKDVKMWTPELQNMLKEMAEIVENTNRKISTNITCQ